MKTKETKPDYIHIDIDSVLRQRLPRHYRYIPRFLIRMVQKWICQDKLNEMLRVNRGKRDADFCRGVIDHLSIRYTIDSQKNLPADGRALFVCNHPLGGLDGMILIDMLTRRYGPGVKFVVNDLLMAIEPLSGTFLPVNKFGRQSRQATAALDSALAGAAPVIIFPAGLVSRKQKGGIADLKWQKMFVNKAIASRRDVIPLHFVGRNSKFFYNFAKLRTLLGIPVNIEMLRLPAEVFRSAGRSYSIRVGAPVKWQNLKGGLQAERQALDIRNASYALAREPLSQKHTHSISLTNGQSRCSAT